MDDVIDNILIGSQNGTIIGGATIVQGQHDNGIYLGDQTSWVDYGVHQSCFYDPDICNPGVTFAMWIKREQGATGYLFDTGASLYAAKGNWHMHYICKGTHPTISPWATITFVTIKGNDRNIMYLACFNSERTSP